MTVIGVGLIGHGDIAEKKLVPALAAIPGVELRCVLGRDMSRAAAFVKRRGIQGRTLAFDDLDTMLDDPGLDAVIIASPDGLHARHAVAAASRGIHVFVEKPMATSSDAAAAMVAACKAANVRLAVGYHHRWHAGHRLIAEKIAAGEIGRIAHFRAMWAIPYDPEGWRNRGSTGRWWSLAALGTHVIDLAWWLLEPSCGEMTRCGATATSAKFGGRDECAAVDISFASGATAHICVAMYGPQIREFDIIGTEGHVRARFTLGGRGAGDITLAKQDWGGLMNFSAVDPYAAELQDFFDSIRDNREPIVGGDVGIKNVALLERLT